jgi:hypothetical protein
MTAASGIRTATTPATARTPWPATGRADRWEAQRRRLEREAKRLVDANQAEAIDLSELRERREQVRGRREVLLTPRDQERRAHTERREAQARWSDLEAFCRRVRSRLDEAGFAERQRILQLLIERGSRGRWTVR